MLPFLNARKQAGVIIAKRVGDKTEDQHEEGEHPPGLMAAAEDILSAVAMKDAKALASAICAAIDCYESNEPSESLEADED